MNPEVTLYCVVSRCVSVLVWTVYLAVVGAVPVVESPGSCRGGAGSIPAVPLAPLPKRGEDKTSRRPAAVNAPPPRPSTPASTHTHTHTHTQDTAADTHVHDATFSGSAGFCLATLGGGGG